MKDIYFSPSVGKRSLRKRATIFLTHWVVVLFPKLGFRLAIKFLANPFSRRSYQMRTLVVPSSVMISTSAGDVCLNKFMPTTNANGRNVFLCHGWGDSSTRFTQLIDHLVSQGDTVWSLDHFGHGKSDGTYSHLFAFIDGVRSALLYLDKHGAAPDCIIGHSMGGLSVLNLPQEMLKNRQVILISAPVSFFDNMSGAVESAGISSAMLFNLLEQVSKQYKVQWQTLVPTKHLAKIQNNFLFIHDSEDKICPYAQIVTLLAGIEHNLYTTHGQGHLKLLKDPLVLAKISEFSQVSVSVDKACSVS